MESLYYLSSFGTDRSDDFFDTGRCTSPKRCCFDDLISSHIDGQNNNGVIQQDKGIWSSDSSVESFEIKSFGLFDTPSPEKFLVEKPVFLGKRKDKCSEIIPRQRKVKPKKKVSQKKTNKEIAANVPDFSEFDNYQLNIEYNPAPAKLACFDINISSDTTSKCTVYDPPLINKIWKQKLKSNEKGNLVVGSTSVADDRNLSRHQSKGTVKQNSVSDKNKIVENKSNTISLQVPVIEDTAIVCVKEIVTKTAEKHNSPVCLPTSFKISKVGLSVNNHSASIICSPTHEPIIENSTDNAGVNNQSLSDIFLSTPECESTNVKTQLKYKDVSSKRVFQSPFGDFPRNWTRNKTSTPQTKLDNFKSLQNYKETTLNESPICVYSEPHKSNESVKCSASLTPSRIPLNIINNSNSSVPKIQWESILRKSVTVTSNVLEKSSISKSIGENPLLTAYINKEKKPKGIKIFDENEHSRSISSELGNRNFKDRTKSALYTPPCSVILNKLSTDSIEAFNAFTPCSEKINENDLIVPETSPCHVGGTFSLLKDKEVVIRLSQLETNHVEVPGSKSNVDRTKSGLSNSSRAPVNKLSTDSIVPNSTNSLRDSDLWSTVLYTPPCNVVLSKLNDDLIESLIVGGKKLYSNFWDSFADVQNQPDPFKRILMLCGQTKTLEFDSLLNRRELSSVIKIGEGSYAEVFKIKSSREDRVLKVVPVARTNPSGEQQMTLDDILSEIIISKEINTLFSNLTNVSTSFIEVKSITMATGNLPLKFFKEWDKFNLRNNSENDNPRDLSEDQLFVIFQYEFGGVDLEHCTFGHLNEVISVLSQIALGLAVSEVHLKFEHRDLHEGNVLVLKSKKKKMEFILEGKKFEIPTFGFEVKIIDFTLSRLEKDSTVVYTDLTEKGLFDGDGHSQYQVYRDMREKTNGDWQSFSPITNVLWLEFLVTRLLERNKKLQNKSKLLAKQLKTWKQTLKKCSSAQEFVTKELT